MSTMTSSMLTTSAAAEAPPQKKKRYLRRIIVSLVAFLVLLMVGTGAGYLAFLNHTVTTGVAHQALLPIPGVGDAIAGDDDGAPTNDVGPAKDPVAKNAMNILLIGSDSRGSVANGRSDVIVLVHISADRKKIHLVHFPRDMYVDVPGHGKDKINAAYAYGGAPLLVRTLQNLVDVKLDQVALIDFEGFKAMTDALGGLDVYAEEASTERSVVRVGLNHLNGEEALAFVRERYELSEGDISRGRRQQAFIEALMLKGLSKETLLNPVRFAQFVAAGAGNLTVDNTFSIADIRSLALQLRDLRGKDIDFITAPITGFGTSPQGASIDIVDTAGMAVLSKALRTDAMSSISLGSQIP